MSRITFAMSNPGGLETMQKAIIQGLNEIIERVVSEIRKDGRTPAMSSTTLRSCSTRQCTTFCWA